MLIRRPPIAGPEPSALEITPREVWLQRRVWLQQMALGAGAVAASSWAGRQAFAQNGDTPHPGRLPPLPGARSSIAGAYAMEASTPYADVTGYNNFYEFGTEKTDPAAYAGSLKTRPWTVQVEGLVKTPKTFGIDDLLKLGAMEERIYRLRCVEGWSMVIPWVGYSLSELLRKVEPLGSAKYVEFLSAADPATMPGVRSSVLLWPYAEGLRLDEAMHPLTLLTFGLYGEVLPKQNGAPLRVVVPWKYGFKSAKSIVKIRLLDKEPPTAWNTAAPQEYGFYSNVNPDVPHPRWSQATERRIGEAGGIFAKRHKTLKFNGYEAQVASLYSGMDLRRYY